MIRERPRYAFERRRERWRRARHSSARFHAKFDASDLKSDFVVFFLFSTTSGASFGRIEVEATRMNAEEVEVQELLLPTIAKKRKREEYHDQVIFPLFPVISLPAHCVAL